MQKNYTHRPSPNRKRVTNKHNKATVLKNIFFKTVAINPLRLYSFQNRLNKIRYGCFIIRISMMCYPIGNDTTHSHRLVPHKFSQTCQCRAFHFIISHDLRTVFKSLYFLVQFRVGQRNSQFPALWPIETIGSCLLYTSDAADE